MCVFCFKRINLFQQKRQSKTEKNCCANVDGIGRLAVLKPSRKTKAKQSDLKHDALRWKYRRVQNERL